jgi:hypothetical protein
MTALLPMAALVRLGDCGLAISLEMEWHMKRLYQRFGVSDAASDEPCTGLKLQSDWKWVLLWRENQRHRPPSKL